MNPVITVPTVHAFTDYTGPQLSADVVLAKGGRTPGDGDGGIFVWNATSALADNGDTVLQPVSVTGVGRWIKISSEGLFNPYSVKDFGAAGDGTTDDTDAIQEAVDTVAASGGALYVPAGTYKATNLDFTSINSDFSKSFRIFGDGPLSSILSQTTGATGNFIDISGSNQIWFEHLGIQPGPNSDVGVLASRLSGVSQNCNYNTFRNVQITGSTTKACFVGVGCESLLFDRVWVNNGSADATFFLGSYNTLSATSAFGTIMEGVPTTDNHFIASRFNTSIASGTPIYLSDSAGTVFTSCSTNNTGVGTLRAHVYVDAPETNQYGWSTVFDGHHFEGDGDCFKFATGASAPTNAVYESFRIVNSTCINSGFKWIAIDGGTDVVHLNLTFENNKGPYPVELQDVQFSTIRHVETGATVSAAGAFDACTLDVVEGGLTGSTLGCAIRQFALFADTGKNYDVYGAADGEQARYIQYIPTSTALDNTQRTAGMIAVAQPPGWDPASVGGTDPYPVFWDGAVWKAMV